MKSRRRAERLVKVVPARRLLILLALAAPLFLVNAGVALLADAVLLLAALMDAVLAAPHLLHIVRTSPRRLSLGSTATVEIELESQAPRALWVRVTDDLPAQLERLGWEGEDRAASGYPPPGGDAAASDLGGRAGPAPAVQAAADEVAARIPAGRAVRLRYRFRAGERGRALLGDVHLRVLGPLGLVWRQRREARSDPVAVQPGLRELRRYRLLAHRHRLREMGLRTMAERGEGTSFESLREYVRGDDPRRLDWKSSAKRDTLVVRQTEAERSQNVLLAIDAGRLMTEELGGDGDTAGRRERLDAALSSALLLAEVASQHGDRVGLLVFSDRVELFIPPSRLPLRRLAEPLAQVQARLVEPDYPGAFAFLSHQLRRRSLVVLFTDVIDARASAALLAHAGAATRRHLPLAVAIRNPVLERTAAAPADDEAAVYRRAAAEELLQLRSVALATMRRAGVLVADTLPDAAVATAVNRYLEVKRRAIL